MAIQSDSLAGLCTHSHRPQRQSAVLTLLSSSTMQPFVKQNWEGDDKIVIGIDIGTTHSAVSYAHLYTGSMFSLPS